MEEPTEASEQSSMEDLSEDGEGEDILLSPAGSMSSLRRRAANEGIAIAGNRIWIYSSCNGIVGGIIIIETKRGILLV